MRESIRYWLGGSKPAVLTLVGAPGAGKTTLLRFLAMKAAGGDLKSQRSLPVLLQLPDHVDDIDTTPGLSLPEAIHDSLGQLQVRGADWFRRKLEDGRCLVLLDGLDEVFDRRQQRAVTAWVEQQVARYPGNDFLIASRELPAHDWLSPKARTLTLQPFTDEQLTECLRHRLLSGLVTSRAVTKAQLDTEVLLNDLRTRPDVLEPVRNPALLALLADTYRFTGRLPDNRTALYGELVERMLSSHTPGAVGELTSAQKLRVVRVLALAMTEDRREEAPGEWCESMIESALRRSGRANAPLFLQLMVIYGILVRRGDGMYAFVHRQFREYLTAVQIAAQGSIRLLVQHVEDPEWRDIILTWASSADASSVIEACLRRGTDDALSLALDCAETSPQIDPELRSYLSRLSRPWRTAEPATDALTAYVEKMYSAPAAELLRRSHDRHQPFGQDDIDGLVQRAESRPAREWSESDASDFLSAAVMAVETGRHGQASGYRFKGLIALAYAIREKSLASSRDLCLAALGRLDRKQPRVADVRLACLAYVGSTADPDDEGAFAGVLRDFCRETGAKACGLLVPLVAAHQAVARLVADALRGDEVLVRRLADDLGTDRAGVMTTTGWDPAVEDWLRARRDIVHQLCGLTRLVLDQESLLQARERVADRLHEQAPGTLELAGLAWALDYLDHFLQSRRFDERDAALRAAARCADSVRAAVRAAPTALSVELSEPVAARIETLALDERRLLAQRHQPQPRIDAALPFARLRGRTVTVPVEVANDGERSAPIESAWLTATVYPARFASGTGRAEVPAPVSGGAAMTVLLPLELTEAARDVTEFEVDVTLRYLPRGGGDDAARQARLTVVVDRAYTPVEPNPFAVGALGRPVDDPDMFFGREELINRIRNRIHSASTPGAGVALFGRKRTGKSSIGVELMRQISEIDKFPVVDVGNLGELTPGRTPDTDQTLLGALLWRILDGADSTITSGPRLIPDGMDREALTKSPDPVLDCRSLFDRYRTAAPESRPWVVFIDEFQYMDRWIRDELVPPSFMRTFKAIVERRLFHLVLVGQSRLERLVEEDPNAFGVFGKERVTCLAEADARALVQQPIMLDTAEGRISRYHERAVEEILRLTGGNPFYIQRICYELVEHMNKERATMVTDADVRRVTQRLLDELKAADFDGLEDPDADDTRWTDTELRAACVAVTRACHEGPASWKEIQACHEGGLDPELLAHLVSREVVRQVGDRYQFVVGLYEEWLRRYFAVAEGRP
ncbi:NACHT domain-containing protein [Streptomyces sp. NPDC057239]|uniref:NACHT domain-containing protein n=1 Tax=Streptomyces sp. NPDC057239 TaxID=3346061 RepID=UPI00363FA445